jgi:LmbE family N-acetylglucosaminyl deacetylase
MRRSLLVFGIPATNIRVERFPVRMFAKHRQEILDLLIRLRAELSPTMVMMPAGEDTHQDHEVIHAECVRAFRAAELWGYELPWNHTTTHTTGYVALEERHIALKEQALGCYESQVKLARPYFEAGLLRGLARVRGLQIKRSFAEAFSVVRTIR